MNNPNTQNPILTRPVYVSARLKTTENSTQVVGNKIVASVKWGNRTYEITITVKKADKSCNLVTLANSDLAKRVEDLARGMFSHLSPVDGQEISSDSDGSITVNGYKKDSPEAIETAQAFKRAIVGDLDASKTTIAREKEMSPLEGAALITNPGIATNTNPLYGTSDAPVSSYRLHGQGDDNREPEAAISPLPTRQFTSNNTFKIFADSNAQNAYFDGETKAVLDTHYANWITKKIYRKERKKILQESARLSRVPRHDYELSIQFLNPDLQAIVNPETLTTSHRLFYTNPYNRSGYLENGQVVYTDHTAESSFNRISSTPTMGRAILDSDGSSIAYTGQPDTEKKARLAMENVVKTEWAARSKSKLKPKDGTDDEFELPILVNGLLSTGSIFGYRHLDNEKPMVEAEEKVMRELYGQTIEVEVEPNKFIKVKVLPFFMNTILNGTAAPKYAKPGLGPINGQATSDRLSKFGDNAFKSYVQTRIDELRNSENGADQKKARKLEGALNALDETHEEDPSLDSINKLINRAFISELLEIPFYAHCKSSIDRTSFATGIISTVHQIYRSGHLEVFKDGERFTPHMIMQNDKHKNAFKDLVILNASVGNVFVEMSRGQPGFGWSNVMCNHFRTARNSNLIDKLRKPKKPPGKIKKQLRKFKRQTRPISADQAMEAVRKMRDRPIIDLGAALPTSITPLTEETKRNNAAIKIQTLIRAHLKKRPQSINTNEVELTVNDEPAITTPSPSAVSVADLPDDAITPGQQQAINVLSMIFSNPLKGDLLQTQYPNRTSDGQDRAKKAIIEDANRQTYLEDNNQL